MIRSDCAWLFERVGKMYGFPPPDADWDLLTEFLTANVGKWQSAVRLAKRIEVRVIRNESARDVFLHAIHSALDEVGFPKIYDPYLPKQVKLVPEQVFVCSHCSKYFESFHQLSTHLAASTMCTLKPTIGFVMMVPVSLASATLASAIPGSPCRSFVLSAGWS